MYEQLTLGICPNVNVTALDFRVKVSALMESAGDSQIPAELYSLKSCGLLKQGTLQFYSPKTCGDFLTTRGGDTFRTIIGTMYELGYNVEWQCINSKYFTPQNRERVYIIGHSRRKPARPVFPIFGNGEAVDGIQGQGIYPAVTSGTITTRTGTAESVGTYPMNNGGVLKVHGFHKLEQREKEDAANGFDVTEGGGLLIDGEEVRIRKLTPRECWRLQGFPDELFERAAAVNSDSQLYKQAGNSVTVNVIYEIAKRLKEGEEDEGTENK